MNNSKSFDDDDDDLSISATAKLQALEAKLASLESAMNAGRQKLDFMVDNTANTEISDDLEEKSTHIAQLTDANTIPGIRKCDFMHFKNRFTEEDGHYAVDVLESGELLDQEIQEEQRFRDKRAQFRKLTSRAAKSRATATIQAANQSNTRALRNVQATDAWIQRIRIQSPVLLSIFAKIQGEKWTPRPRTYFRPFESLVYFHPRVKKALEDLQKGATHPEGTSPATTVGSPRESLQDTDDPIEASPAALSVLKAYVKFFDEEIMPEYESFQTRDYSSDAEVRFSDLWYLFRTGEYIYQPLDGDNTQRREFQTGKKVWRTFCISLPDKQHHRAFEDHRKYETQDQDETAAAVVVRAYYVEYSGEEFTVVTKNFPIFPFKGRRAVNTLPIFPLRFVEGSAELWDLNVQIGEKVLHYIDAKHGSYNGWTITRTPSGELVVDAAGEVLKHAEHINSEVMIDFSESFHTCPAWKTKRKILKPRPVNQSVISDEFPIYWWSDDSRTKLLGESSEIIPVRTGVSMWQANEHIVEDELLAAIRENDNRGRFTTKEFLRDEDKALITGRVFGYVFQERKFAQLDIQKMKQSSGTREALDSLKIDSKTKDLIQRSIRGHFLMKAAERENGDVKHTQDLIQGKGGGLFILLHGMPGVGKTATAEAIAQANGKPLFKITCGDVGLTPEQVETSLRNIFRLASSWDCILLLDEVDTFFSTRSKGDAALKKNALVSVFLRVLDYYSGILFLTTNRPGALDEAFKSRIHHKIYYPRLTRSQTLDIWEINIRQLRKIENEQSGNARRGLRGPIEIREADLLTFAAEQFDRAKSDDDRWNGRQIRNAFQVARSLAYSDAALHVDMLRREGSNEVSAPLRLEVKHFELMHNITDDFNRYMKEVKGGFTDSEIAQEHEQRADYWVNQRTTREYDDHEVYISTHGERRPAIHDSPSAGRGRSSNWQSKPTHAIGANIPPRSPKETPDEPVGGKVSWQGPFSSHSHGGSQVRPGAQHASPTIMLSTASPGEGDYDTQGHPENSRFAPDYRPAMLSPKGHDRHASSGPTHSRDYQRHSDFEFDNNYDEGKNRYGKRERYSDDRSQY